MEEAKNLMPLRLRQYQQQHRECQDEICPQVSYTWLKPSTPFTTSDVLINNWVEDRRKYIRTNHAHNSTTRIDYIPFCGPTVDEAVRRRAKLRNEGGLPLHHLFHHDGAKAHGGRMISVYDEQFTRKGEWLKIFPEERSWSVSHDLWRPERNDFPLKAEPTNWGLLERLQMKWKKQADDEMFDPRLPDYRSTYQRSYGIRPDPSAYTLTRYATPQVESFSQNPVDKINKNMAPYHRSNQPEIIARPLW